ncbi:hypothetical protein NG798_09280 [Ancylothrix sp. C2]|uniref:hypothetical protein n=1 Tax=Ancylothrix sp. D3o TaxID=2953691 RepID=UPI0021BB65B7|nr:hypothetical protein [Ancylothrix sp. D3o]MCT7949977.1 hypothetical protein [Ancylothrix sp. D3o]
MLKLFFQKKSQLTGKLSNSSSADRHLRIPGQYNLRGGSSLLERLVFGVAVMFLLVSVINLTIINYRPLSEQKPVEEMISD